MIHPAADRATVERRPNILLTLAGRTEYAGMQPGVGMPDQKEATMKIVRKLTGDCKGGDCPAVYTTDRGTLVIQGYVLDAPAIRQLTLPTGESAVEVPAELLLAAARQVKASE
jgi:hypothetical protein